ncbi:MAG: hypothetical protein Q7S71_06165 [Candidatus Nitrotoga sp.]|nr:hypothetical protein [Candidatus Nitrotoga sp.]
MNCIILLPMTRYAIDGSHKKSGHNHFMLQNTTFGGEHGYFDYVFVAG